MYRAYHQADRQAVNLGRGHLIYAQLLRRTRGFGLTRRPSAQQAQYRALIKTCVSGVMPPTLRAYLGMRPFFRIDVRTLIIICVFSMLASILIPCLYFQVFASLFRASNFIDFELMFY